MEYYVTNKKFGTSKTIYLNINLHPLLKLENFKTRKKVTRQLNSFPKIYPIDSL